jgi:hypothetical protein
MGQNSNLLTLRKSKKKLNLLNANSKLFLYGFNFLKSFENLLRNKDIFIVDRTINFVGNYCFLNLMVFFRAKKTKKYFRSWEHSRKQKSLVLKSGELKKQLISHYSIKKESVVSNFFNKNFELFKNTTVVFTLKNLNKDAFEFFGRYFYYETKQYSKALFERRLNLHLDFLKMSSLFAQSKITGHSYLYLLGQIFRFVHKRNHNKFFAFIKSLFMAIVKKFPLKLRKLKIQLLKLKKQLRLLNLSHINSYNGNNILKLKLKQKQLLKLKLLKLISPLNFYINGLKLIVNGKIKGKLRSSFSSVKSGSVPIQTINKNIDFAQIHVYTLYGAFGLKLWVCHKQK